jgi:ribosomal protein S5
MDLEEDTFRQETNIEKKEELEMLEAFEKRRKFKVAYDTIDGLDEDVPLEESERLKEKKQQQEEKGEKPEQLLMADFEKNEIYDSSKFTLMFLDADMVCNMTRLNRVYERRVLMYIGNKQGMISYAIGRGAMYQDAYINGYKELKKNLIVIDTDSNFTLANDLKARFNDYRLLIKSTYNPSLWGSPMMCLMLRYAGLLHVSFKIISRKKEPYAMVFAFFKAVTRSRSPTQVLEAMNMKGYRHYIGRPRRYEYTMVDGDNKY